MKPAHFIQRAMRLPEPSIPTAPQQAAPPSSGPAALGHSVSADLVALKNDVEQARELAGEYQRQLAGKSNDLAALKMVFEKTSADLAHLHEGITQLREERHRFANDSMRAAALEIKLARMTAERDALRQEVEEFRHRPPSDSSKLLAQLAAEVANLRAQLNASGRKAPRPSEPERSAGPGAGAADRIAIAFSGAEIDQGVTVVATEPAPMGAHRVRRGR